MTTRIKGLTVALEHDIREDDIESTIEAIKHIRGVLSVTTVPVDSDDYVNRSVIRNEFMDKLRSLLIDNK